MSFTVVDAETAARFMRRDPATKAKGSHPSPATAPGQVPPVAQLATPSGQPKGTRSIPAWIGVLSWLATTALAAASVAYAYQQTQIAERASNDARQANNNAESVRKQGVASQVLVVGGILEGKAGNKGIETPDDDLSKSFQRYMGSFNYQIQNFSRLPVGDLRLVFVEGEEDEAGAESTVWALGGLRSCGSLPVQKYINEVAREIIVPPEVGFKFSVYITFTDPDGNEWRRGEETTPEDLTEAQLEELRNHDPRTDDYPPAPAVMKDCAPA